VYNIQATTKTRLAVVTQNFEGNTGLPGDLPLHAGDTIVLTRAPRGSDWWTGYAPGDPSRKVGVFPSAYVNEITAAVDTPTAELMLRQLSSEARDQAAHSKQETEQHDHEAVYLTKQLQTVQNQLEMEQKRSGSGEERCCVICFDDSRLGVQCTGSVPHFICAECVNGLVASEAQQEPRHIELRHGKIFCPLLVAKDFQQQVR
jgi:hypothetical protein